jgi:hypothetical protein
MLDGRQLSELSGCISQKGGVENAVPLRVDILRTGGRRSDLAFEAVLQEYL